MYALANPSTDEIRYVGKTLQVPRDRLRCHMRDMTGRMAHTWLSRWLRTLGGEPSLIVLEECRVGDGCVSERRWIADLRAQGCNLTNLTEGGEGVPGFRMSDEAKAKIAAAARLRRHTDETREKISRLKRTPGSPKSRYAADGSLRVTDPGARDRAASERLKRRWQERREDMLAIAAAAAAAPRSADTNRKRAASMRRVWAQPGERERRGAAIATAKRRRVS